MYALPRIWPETYAYHGGAHVLREEDQFQGQLPDGNHTAAVQASSDRERVEPVLVTTFEISANLPDMIFP